MKKIIIICCLVTSLSTFLHGQDNLVKIELEFKGKGYDAYQQFAGLAAGYLEEVINSEEFEKRVLRRKFTKKNGKTNAEIYEAIMNAYEKQCPDKKDKKVTVCPEGEKGIINLRVRTIDESDGSKWLNVNCKLDSRAGTIGIDGLGDGITAICPQRLEKWYTEKRIDKLAGHYMHEYMHILGFGHRGMRKRRSAVYKIGDIAEALVFEKILRDLYAYKLSGK